ncbi:MAG: hypothetical protein IBX56_14265, partial [Methylomicrobium sp.]|nr:hypothetical protein [Methylomicrobium sp.]
MKFLDIELDDVESVQLQRFCSVNNVSEEEAAALLIRQQLNEWVDSIIDEVQSP